MTNSEIYENNLQHFKIKRRYSNKAQCICPAHEDKQASLTVAQGDKCTILHCHAGCKVDDILQAVGLNIKDTFYDVEPRSPNWKKYIESREKRKIEAVYHYVSCNGRYAFTKIRLEEKRLLYGILENERFRYGLPRNTPRKSLKAIYGSVQAINKAITEGKPIFIPEGEKDVDTLTKRGYVAFTYGSSSDWQSEFAELVKDADVVILADNDKPGIAVANTILKDIKTIAKSVKIIVPMPDIPKADITDYFEAGHSKEEFEQMINVVTEKSLLPEVSQVEVERLLSYKVDYDKDGNVKGKKILQTVRNFEIIMENDGRFAGKIKFDEFSQQTFLMGSVPWESKKNYRAWGSYDDSALFSILQSDYGMNSRNDYFDALKNVATKNKFHPVRDILDSLVWDGQDHIKDLLPDYLGVEDTEYQYQVMKLWMLGAVSRIYKPGCKFDYTVIFKGRQGLGKSTFLQLLALNDNWFNDSLDSLDSDKSAQSLMGSWIIELAELKSLARTAGGVDSVKRFLTATQDKYRVPYERRADIFLRQCVFAGTTNKEDFLQDETGNRRFLIIEAGENEPRKNLFESESINDFKAAWAQAVYIVKNEKPKLILPDSCRKRAEELQAESMSDDGKVGIIQEYLSNKQRTCAIEIWREALQETGRPAKWQASEINNIVLSFPEWKRMQYPAKFGMYGSQRGFQKCSLQSQNEDDSKQECSQGFMNLTDSELSEIPFD